MERYITDIVEFTGKRPEPFEGMKKYISTGALILSNIDNNAVELIEYYSRPSRADLEVKPGDLVFAKMSNTDKRLIINEETSKYIYSTGFFAVKAKQGVITTKCLYYLLGSKNFLDQKDKNSTGATQRAITIDGLSKIKVRIPDYISQKNIEIILELLDEIVKLRKNQINEYDQLIKSRFVEMFGDVFSRKSKFKTKKIGELVISKVERASKYFDSESEIKYIDISSIDNSNNVITGYTQYFMKDAPSRAQQHVKKHDILISTVRPNLNNVAKVQYDFDNLVASSGFCVLRSTEIEPEYLFSFVSRNEFANYLSSLTTGASYPAVSDKDILNIEIPYPPKDKQLEFVNFHRQVDKLKFENEILYSISRFTINKQTKLLGYRGVTL